jgi:hypothetical protein
LGCQVVSLIKNNPGQSVRLALILPFHPPLFYSKLSLLSTDRDKLKSDISRVFTMASNPNSKITGQTLWEMLFTPDSAVLTFASTARPMDVASKEALWSKFCELEPSQVESGLIKERFEEVIELVCKSRRDEDLTKEACMSILGGDFIFMHPFLVGLQDNVGYIDPSVLYWKRWDAAELNRYRGNGWSDDICSEPPHWLMNSRDTMVEFFTRLGEYTFRAYQERLADMKQTIDREAEGEESYQQKVDNFIREITRDTYSTFTLRCQAALHAEGTLDVDLE